jgi:hypothetical protein
MPEADTLMLNIIDRRSVRFAVSISSIQNTRARSFTTCTTPISKERQNVHQSK